MALASLVVEPVAIGPTVGPTLAPSILVDPTAALPGALTVGSTPVSSTAATGQPAATVRIPDVTSMTVQDAEKVITQAGLVMEVSGDHDGRVLEQFPTAGTMVPAATSVRLTLTADPVLPVTPNHFLPAAIAAAVMVMIGGLAMTVRYRVRRRRQLRWIDEHVDLVLEPGLLVRAQRSDPDGVDHEIQVVVNPQDDLVSVLEVQR